MNLPARWTSLELILQDILYISYRLPTNRVRPHVPPTLPLATVGADEVFVTAMVARVERARMARLPSPHWSYTLGGVFTYVRSPGEAPSAVFCLRQGITHPRWQRILRWARFPVEEAQWHIQAERARRDMFTRFHVQGEWHGEVTIHVHQVAPRLEALPPFADGTEAVVYLTDALVGYYRGGRGVYRLDMWHPRAQPRVGEAEQIHFPFLQAMFSMTPEEVARPAVVLMAPRQHYLLHLPPRKEA